MQVSLEGSMQKTHPIVGHAFFLCRENKIKPKSANFKCEKCPFYTLANKYRTKCLTRQIVLINPGDEYGIGILIRRKLRQINPLMPGSNKKATHT